MSGAWSNCAHYYISFYMPLTCSGAADTSIAECNALLTTTAGYDVANDIPEQRNALIEFYNSTGGDQWSNIATGSSLRDQVNYYEYTVTTIGTLAQQAGFSAAALPADSQQLYYAIAQLSVDCRLQASSVHFLCVRAVNVTNMLCLSMSLSLLTQTTLCLQRILQLVKLLVKWPWGTSGELSKLGPKSRMFCCLRSLISFCRCCYHCFSLDNMSWENRQQSHAAIACNRTASLFPEVCTLKNAGQSYCYWQGVACCQTAGDFFTQYCSLGSQSVAQIFLTGMTLVCILPLNFPTTSHRVQAAAHQLIICCAKC